VIAETCGIGDEARDRARQSLSLQRQHDIALALAHLEIDGRRVDRSFVDDLLQQLRQVRRLRASLQSTMAESDNF